MRDYLFECRCSLCLENIDARRSLPCPACGVQRDPETGLLPAAQPASSERQEPHGMCAASEDGSWHCSRCKQVSSSAEMDVAIAPEFVAEFLPGAPDSPCTDSSPVIRLMVSPVSALTMRTVSALPSGTKTTCWAAAIAVDSIRAALAE